MARDFVDKTGKGAVMITFGWEAVPLIIIGVILLRVTMVLLTLLIVTITSKIARGTPHIKWLQCLIRRYKQFMEHPDTN